MWKPDDHPAAMSSSDVIVCLCWIWSEPSRTSRSVSTLSITARIILKILPKGSPELISSVHSVCNEFFKNHGYKPACPQSPHTLAHVHTHKGLWSIKLISLFFPLWELLLLTHWDSLSIRQTRQALPTGASCRIQILTLSSSALARLCHMLIFFPQGRYNHTNRCLQESSEDATLAITF